MTLFCLPLSYISASWAVGLSIVFSAILFGLMCHELALKLGASEMVANLVFFGATAAFLIVAAVVLELSRVILGIVVVAIVICVIGIIWVVWNLIHK